MGDNNNEIDDNRKFINVTLDEIKNGMQLEICLRRNMFPLKSEKIDKKASKPLKDPKTIEDQVKKLDSHGVTFTEEEKKEALELLRFVNYYRISIYVRYLEEERKSFTRLMELYYFDRFLRINLANLLNPVEEFLRTSLAYYLSTNYPECLKRENKKQDEICEKKYHPSLCYLDMNLYKKSRDAEKMLSEIYETISKNIDREASLAHYVEFYEGNLPI